MKIPNRNTCAYALCKTIYTEGARTMGTLFRDLKGRYTATTIKAKLEELLSTGHLVRTPIGKYANSERMVNYFDQCETDLEPAVRKTPPAPAGPRYIPEFKALSRATPMYGMRPGADDFRNWPSRQLP